MTVIAKKILKWSILAILLTYVAVMGVWANQRASLHLCTGIVVDVETTPVVDSIVRHGVNERLRAYPHKIVGMPQHQIDIADIERYLSRDNIFESVNCMMSARGELIIEIVPMIPVMRLFFGNDSYYINKDGKYVASSAQFMTDVPVVTGNFNKHFSPKVVIPIVSYINKNPMLHDLVSMIHAENAHNIILIPKIRGHVINFGDTTRLDEKSRALTLFYRDVIPYKGWEEYDTISVKYRGQIVATRRDKTRLNHGEDYVEEIDPEEATLADVGDLHGTVHNPADTTHNKKKTDKPQGASNHKPQG
ncbi:MAG: cell division protein FtsQ/DivIB [Lepagella sp.]